MLPQPSNSERYCHFFLPHGHEVNPLLSHTNELMVLSKVGEKSSPNPNLHAFIYGLFIFLELKASLSSQVTDFQHASFPTSHFQMTRLVTVWNTSSSQQSKECWNPGPSQQYFHLIQESSIQNRGKKSSREAKIIARILQAFVMSTVPEFTIHHQGEYVMKKGPGWKWWLWHCSKGTFKAVQLRNWVGFKRCLPCLPQDDQ